ncbi:hypothetical protein CJNNKLLH_3112 [Methylorubrum thiocyanatum]|nr:hypothetical protein CJNNKLLH_3112 [Methylorubrum thiocyanatum]
MDKSFPSRPETRVPLAVALAFLAGAADSIGFLEHSQLFMSFMSGNTTRFGVAASSFDWSGVARFGSTIALFCFGAFVGTLVAAWAGRWRLSVLLGAQAALLSIGNILPEAPDAFPLHAYPVVLALGMLNATLQDEAGRSLALTYVTGTVVRFGTGLANMVLHKPAPSFWLQAPLWAGLTIGAVAGGFIQKALGPDAFLVPAALSASLAVAGIILTVALPGSGYVSNEWSAQPDAHPDAPATAR